MLSNKFHELWILTFVFDWSHSEGLWCSFSVEETSVFRVSTVTRSVFLMCGGLFIYLFNLFLSILGKTDGSIDYPDLNMPANIWTFILVIEAKLWFRQNVTFALMIPPDGLSIRPIELLERHSKLNRIFLKFHYHLDLCVCLEMLFKQPQASLFRNCGWIKDGTRSKTNGNTRHHWLLNNIRIL